ncbi:MAG TPA: wax ester/triacylglycerol synthase family O-acyltransferase [Streptosporangiaceae bacterium]|nr:wax ester/triacylglycerol synthase family O-acyltransferase [Streptosporangiaceae bacterium]
MERMNNLDAGFYFVEHENVPMHLGSLAVFQGPFPGCDEMLRLFSAKLPNVPRYRQVVRTTWWQVFRPYWADDEHFDIARHLRQATVPAPGGKRQLCELAAKIFAEPLDRSQPLWEGWLLDGLKGGQWAVLSKVHHCMVDGIGGNDLMAAVFDISPDAPRPEPEPWHPEPEPSGLELMFTGLQDAIARPVQQLAGLLERPLPSAAGLGDYSRGLAASVQRLAVPSAASLNGPIGPARRWTWLTASLATIKEIGAALGGTVNDVLLAAITSGFRDLLDTRGELADGVVVRSLVPVSVRSQDEQGIITNKVSAVLANLPVSEPDPLRRLALLREQMNEMKRTSQERGAEMLTGLLGFTLPALLAYGARAAFQIPQPLVQTVTTNVPGPPIPLYVLGRKLTRIYPYAPIGDNERISVAMLSYSGQLAFGITTDYAAVPDLAVLTRGIRRGLAGLTSLAQR